jgi:hypothetical protein
MNKDKHDARELATEPTTRENKRNLYLATGEGCICQNCEHVYQVDLMVPDELWREIRCGENLLCAECIGHRIELASSFAAYSLVGIDSGYTNECCGHTVGHAINCPAQTKPNDEKNAAAMAERARKFWYDHIDTIGNVTSDEMVEFTASEVARALADQQCELAELRDFVKSLNTFVFEEWYGVYEYNKFVIFDSDSKAVAEGNDALEAWNKLKELK